MSLFIRDGLSLPLSAVLGCPSDSVILKSGPLLGVIPQASIAERLGRQGVGWAHKLAEREVNNTAGSSVGSGWEGGGDETGPYMVCTRTHSLYTTQGATNALYKISAKYTSGYGEKADFSSLAIFSNSGHF